MYVYVYMHIYIRQDAENAQVTKHVHIKADILSDFVNKITSNMG